MSDAEVPRRIADNGSTGTECRKGHPIGRGRLDGGPIGELGVVWSARGVMRIDFGGTPDDALALDVEELEVPEAYAGPLRAYLTGQDLDLSAVPVDLVGTDFQLRVWQALREVGVGKTRSYAGIAADVGSPRAMRAVGMANSRNPAPILVPCHRIVEAGNKLGGFTGGLDRKRWLLTHEGARLDGDQVRPGQLGLFDEDR